MTKVMAALLKNAVSLIKMAKGMIFIFRDYRLHLQFYENHILQCEISSSTLASVYSKMSVLTGRDTRLKHCHTLVAYIQCPLNKRLMQYLIWKLSISINGTLEDKDVAVLLSSATPLWKKTFYYIQRHRYQNLFCLV